MTQSEAHNCSRRQTRENAFVFYWLMKWREFRKRYYHNNFVPDILAFSTYRKEPILIHTTVHINNITYFELQFHLKQNKSNSYIFIIV